MSVHCALGNCEKAPNPRGETIEPTYLASIRGTAPRRHSKMEDVNACVLALDGHEQELVCTFAITPQTEEGLQQWRKWITRRGRGYQRLRASLRKLEANLAKRGLV